MKLGFQTDWALKIPKKKKKKETHTKTKANKQGEFMRDKHVVKWLFSLSFTFSYR